MSQGGMLKYAAPGESGLLPSARSLCAKALLPPNRFDPLDARGTPCAVAGQRGSAVAAARPDVSGRAGGRVLLRPRTAR